MRGFYIQYLESKSFNLILSRPSHGANGPGFYMYTFPRTEETSAISGGFASGVLACLALRDTLGGMLGRIPCSYPCFMPRGDLTRPARWVGQH
ncbi:hypothetical protein IMZ48_19595 [Candidatus Bathyarchaeota archaeon]|nr:hypothetical protein [Candidatus Bathyarchaeota archaeon]